MMRVAISPAAGSLVRALARRSGLPRERFAIADIHSTDWQSLTFTGERHVLSLRLSGDEALSGTRRLTDGLSEAELALGRSILADIAVMAERHCTDPSGQIVAVEIEIEALTVEE